MLTREDYYWVQDGNVPNPLIKTHNDAVNKIYDEHEAQLKAKDEHIAHLQDVYIKLDVKHQKLKQEFEDLKDN